MALYLLLEIARANQKLPPLLKLGNSFKTISIKLLITDLVRINYLCTLLSTPDLHTRINN